MSRCARRRSASTATVRPRQVTSAASIATVTTCGRVQDATRPCAGRVRFTKPPMCCGVAVRSHRRAAALAVCPGCSPIHGSCPFGPNTCSCEAGWVGPDCTLPAGPDSVITLGEWVKQHARLLFEAVGGGCFFIVLVSAVYMNHWARRAAAGVKKQRRVHWAADVVTHDDRADRGGDDAGRASSRGRRVRPKWRGPARRPRAASPVPGQPAAAGAPDAEVKPVEGVEGSA